MLWLNIFVRVQTFQRRPFCLRTTAATLVTIKVCPFEFDTMLLGLTRRAVTLFPPSLSISYIKICHILSQNVKYGTPSQMRMGK